MSATQNHFAALGLSANSRPIKRSWLRISIFVRILRVLISRYGPRERSGMEFNSLDNSPSIVPISVGTMGWSYTDWNGVLYPDGAENQEWLRLYARTFDTVEIDSTFYGTPRRSVVTHWLQSTPDSFVFCSKVPRTI